MAHLGRTPVDRRSLLKGLAALGGLAAVPGLAACGEGRGGESSGLTFGSNASDEFPKRALKAVFDEFSKQSGIEVDVNTVDHDDFQENISTYLQGGADDVFTWFAGYRMQFFAAQGYLADISDLWSDWGGDFDASFKQASTGEDDKQYLVPAYYYPWAVFYRKSLFEDKGYTIPTTLDEYTALCEEMQKDGIVPIGFADKEGWPALGTFDALNFRQNGYDFHMRLMQGEESWTSDEVRSVFKTWADLMPYHQPGALEKDWLDAAASFVNKEVGMYYLGMFIGEAFEDQEREDLDFFPFPAINPEFGQDTVEAPIDGYLMSADAGSPDDAKELLRYLATAEAQELYMSKDPNNIPANSNVDTSSFNALQQKAVQIVGDASHVTQFLDRDTNPSFASNVMIGACQDFINNPGNIDGLTSAIEKQARSIFDG